MPQVDLETLVCGGGGGGEEKVACETLVAGDRPTPADPPGSFRLPVEDEIDWVDRNAAAIAAFYDRDESTRGTANPKSHHHHHSNSKPQITSHRFSSSSSKPKARPIIGLPNKVEHSGYLGRSDRRHQTTVRIFPKKTAAVAAGGRKSAVPESEPTSPKVSCFGRVLSDKDRDRCRRACGKVSRENSGESAAAEEKTGFWAALFGFSWCRKRLEAAEWADEDESWPSRRFPAATAVEAETVTAAAPSLAGMKRFTSVRRAASWGGDVDVDLEGHMELSGPLERVGILGRRSVESLDDLDCHRDWGNAGPASV